MEAEMINKAKKIYERLKDRQLDPDNDPIKQLHNILDLITVYLKQKPAFYYGDEDVQAKGMEFLISSAKDAGLRIKLTSCVRNYDFIKSISTIPEPLKTAYIEYRHEIDSNTTGLWIYQDGLMDSKIALATQGKLDYGELLGYPPCCVKENLITMSKMHEFFLQHYLTTYKGKDANKIIDLIDNPDIPQPDANAMNKSAYKLRMNNLPYVSHLPCQNCLTNDKGPSQIINQQRKELAKVLDEEIGIFLTEFVTYYNEANP